MNEHSHTLREVYRPVVVKKYQSGRYTQIRFQAGMRVSVSFKGAPTDGELVRHRGCGTWIVRKDDGTCINCDVTDIRLLS